MRALFGFRVIPYVHNGSSCGRRAARATRRGGGALPASFRAIARRRLQSWRMVSSISARWSSSPQQVGGRAARDTNSSCARCRSMSRNSVSSCCRSFSFVIVSIHFQTIKEGGAASQRIVRASRAKPPQTCGGEFRTSSAPPPGRREGTRQREFHFQFVSLCTNAEGPVNQWPSPALWFSRATDTIKRDVPRARLRDRIGEENPGAGLHFWRARRITPHAFAACPGRRLSEGGGIPLSVMRARLPAVASLAHTPKCPSSPLSPVHATSRQRRRRQPCPTGLLPTISRTAYPADRVRFAQRAIGVDVPACRRGACAASSPSRAVARLDRCR